MQIFKEIDRWMLRRFPKYRLHRICKAIGIRPYGWQRDYVLSKGGFLSPEIRRLRANGKTTAIMLRILMIPNNKEACRAEAGRILQFDPDWRPDRIRWYSGEYRRLKNLCLKAGIPVMQAEIYRMLKAREAEIWEWANRR